MVAAKKVLGLEGLTNDLDDALLSGVEQKVTAAFNQLADILHHFTLEKTEAQTRIAEEQHARMLEAEELAAWDKFALEFIRSNLARSVILPAAFCEDAGMFASKMITLRRDVFVKEEKK
jgi:hypothetical protein